MNLKELIGAEECLGVYGARGLDVVLNGIAYDSRDAVAGDCFICIRGYASDGHEFIPQAAKNGAEVFVIDSPERLKSAIENVGDKTILLVEDSRRALSFMADRFYGSPSKKMTVIGVTGTNGKTSVTTYLYNALQKMGIPAGLIGTIENRIGREVLKTDRTTPESLELHRLFDRMAKKGIQYVIMEVSSHALELERVRDVDFDVAVFTNLTQDHLDFHENMGKYAEAKFKLLEKAGRIAIINYDDPYGRTFADRLRSRGRNVFTYGMSHGSDATAQYDGNAGFLAVFAHGGRDILEGKVSGRFEIYNKLAAYAVLDYLGFDGEKRKSAFSGLTGAEGRFQKVPGPKGCAVEVIVDYAHTPDALFKIIETVNEFKKGRLITVFGCGGERDSMKRPLMGAIASEGSDFVIITDDNPRHEDPDRIIMDITAGIEADNYMVIRDRKKAIKVGIAKAAPGDVVLIAGKGHEKIQIIGDEKITHDDLKEAKNALEEIFC